MIAICAALQWEARAVLRALARIERRDIGSIRAWCGKAGGSPILVFRTGMGCARAADATRAVLDATEVSTVLNTGCAGALAPGLARGAVVVASQVVSAEAPDPLATDAQWRDRLSTAAQRAGMIPHCGTTATTAAPLLTPADKRACGQRFAALSVDMEGAAIASVARERGIAFAAVRVVLDDVDTDLSPVGGIAGDDGRVRPWRALPHVLAHPGTVPELVALAGAARSAERALALLFRALFGDRAGH